MNTRREIRQSFQIARRTVLAVMLVAWLWSLAWGLCFASDTLFFSLTDGVLVFQTKDPKFVSPDTWDDWGWWVQSSWYDEWVSLWNPIKQFGCLPIAPRVYAPHGSQLVIPLWPIWTAAAYPTVLLTLRFVFVILPRTISEMYSGVPWSKYPVGHCQRCDYDLTGNVSGRCPECGKVTEAPPKRAIRFMGI